MAQINVYIPDDLEKKIRKQAKAAGKSLSAFIVELARQRVEKRTWHPNFFSKVIGGWKGPAPEIESLSSAEREDL